MNFYLTLNEEPIGLFESQIVDVVSFLDKEFKPEILLISFISIRSYFKHRKIIKSYSVRSVVLPSFPKLIFFKFNILALFFLCFIYKPKGIIARNIFACFLAIKCRDFKFISKVVYDGRGYMKAEAEEYKIFNDNVSKMISGLEDIAVNCSDFVMAITKQMVHCWKSQYNYKKNNYVIIPNTLGENFNNLEIKLNDINLTRSSLGYKSDEIILIYSGSTAKWQSIDNIIQFCRNQLQKNTKVKVLFLSKITKELDQLINDYPARASRMWLDSEGVSKYMMVCDYGLLLRTKSITNSVSFSTKFAEYLSCGLKVITTNFMSISDFVEINNAGLIIEDINFNTNLFKPKIDEKIRINNLAINNFNKNSPNNYKKYCQIMDIIS
jgi:hypothetical protein